MLLDETVRVVVARTFQLAPETVTAETGYGHPEAWDSLGHLVLMMELEAALKVRFSTEQLARPRNVAQLVQLAGEVLSNE